MLFETMHSKSYMAQASSSTPPPVYPTPPSEVAPVPVAAPALVSSYRPGPPLNVPTGPSAALENTAGPSTDRRPMNGDRAGQAMEVDRENGHSLPLAGPQGGRQKCFDYHSERPNVIPSLTTYQPRAIACEVPIALMNTLTI